jgi:hypothetical protein
MKFYSFAGMKISDSLYLITRFLGRLKRVLWLLRGNDKELHPNDFAILDLFKSIRVPFLPVVSQIDLLKSTADFLLKADQVHRQILDQSNGLATDVMFLSTKKFVPQWDLSVLGSHELGKGSVTSESSSISKPAPLNLGMVTAMPNQLVRQENNVCYLHQPGVAQLKLYIMKECNIKMTPWRQKSSYSTFKI